MLSLISGSDTSTFIRLKDQNTLNIVMVLSATAGTPAYSQIIFNVSGEQGGHFKDNVRLVIIVIHKLNTIITILRT